MSEESARALMTELLHRQHSRVHRARALEEQARRAQESGLEHARLSAVLEFRLGRDSRSVLEEREVADTWFTQARRLYDEAAATLIGAS